MSEPNTTATGDRGLVQILAFAAREFDRVRDLVIDDDEPGPEAVEKEPVPATPAAPEKKRRLIGRVLAGAGTTASTAARLVTGSVHPRHDDWANASLDDRVDWWVERFGTAAAALAAVPGLGGKLGKVVGVGGVVAAAAQVLVVNAVAREMGVTDIDQRVRAAAKIAFGQSIDSAVVKGAVGDADAQPDPDLPGDAPKERTGLVGKLGRTAALIWRVARRIWSYRWALEKRQQGGLFSQALSNLPVVGALGAFVSERKGISRAAQQARQSFA